MVGVQIWCTVLNVPSSSRKPAYTVISLVTSGFQKLLSNMKSSIRLNWDILFWTSKSQIDQRYPWISQFGKRYSSLGIPLHVTYPRISLDILCEIGYRGLTWLNPTYTSCLLFQQRKGNSWCKSVQTLILVLGYPGISHSINPWISHLFWFDFELSSDIPSVFV